MGGSASAVSIGVHLLVGYGVLMEAVVMKELKFRYESGRRLIVSLCPFSMENDPSNRDGYPALSKWISRDPDHETFIFRRFKQLSARNLLHLQSQLIALEIRLAKLDEEIWQDQNLEVRQSLRRWESFVQRFGDPMTAGTGVQVNERVKLVIDLQNKLKEYRE